MMKNYTAPEMEITKFEMTDILTVSGDVTLSVDTDKTSTELTDVSSYQLVD